MANIRIDIQTWLELNFEEVKSATFPLVHVNCPYCHDTKMRLYIATEEANNYKQGWGWCHNEQVNRPFVELFAYLGNMSDEEAREQLFSEDPEPPYGKAADALNSYFATKETKVKEKPQVVWPDGYIPLYKLSQEEWHRKVPSYLTGRGIDQSICDKYYLGYSTNDRKFSGRLIVPIYQGGELVGFQGRAMHNGMQPKYLFMDGISAGDYLFNLDYAKKYKEAILVEGVFDVWGMNKAGFLNSVGSFGKHLTDQGIKTLIKNFESVLIFWDNDAKEEIMELANELDTVMPTRVGFLNGKDPGEAGSEAIIDAVSKARNYSRGLKFDFLIDSI